MADGLRVIEVDIDDIPSMERFVAFENSVRTERTRTVQERRGAAEWTSASAFYLVERAGELVATANAFVQDVDAGASVNLQVAMLHPYDAAQHVVASVEAWRPAGTPTRIVAHLVNAPEAELDAWAVLGFERVGTRTAWERRVEPGSTFEMPSVTGVDVV
ncbi:MAG: hypothetical protein JWN72_2640, partial [Thermoleophilia bacterium]|nr:hypothetical protein [Thermoleophilia bacterium]